MLYIFELFGTSSFFYEHIVDPTALRDVLHLSVVEFSNILRNRWMLASELSRPEYGLYFRPHNDCIEFLFQILEKKSTIILQMTQSRKGGRIFQVP